MQRGEKKAIILVCILCQSCTDPGTATLSTVISLDNWWVLQRCNAPPTSLIKTKGLIPQLRVCSWQKPLLKKEVLSKALWGQPMPSDLATWKDGPQFSLLQFRTTVKDQPHLRASWVREVLLETASPQLVSPLPSPASFRPPQEVILRVLPCKHSVPHAPPQLASRNNLTPSNLQATYWRGNVITVPSFSLNFISISSFPSS